jgi:A/G-specific adenine glycosylase
MAGEMLHSASGASSLPAPLRCPRWKQALRRRLANWFHKHGRKLPWRATRDPYAIWVSEVMLQQTQVATVVPYFERFLAAFPNIHALAAATPQQVLRLWEGLGYYRRARQLHHGAGLIVADHDGRFPREYQQVIQLPGIGRYTAGAILSLAFDQRRPIVEANTLRVYCRLLAYRGDPRSAAGQRLLWNAAEACLPRRRPGLYNQAIMELGSQVCTAANPRCEVCPIQTLCPTRTLGWQALIPRRPRRPPIEDAHEALVVVFHRRRLLLVRRAETGRWAGMWDFPRFRRDPRRSLGDLLAEHTGVRAGRFRRLTTLKHAVTRFRITLDCYRATVKDRPRGLLSANGSRRSAQRHAMRWVSPEDLGDYALCVTARKVARLISEER